MSSLYINPLWKNTKTSAVIWSFIFLTLCTPTLQDVSPTDKCYKAVPGSVLRLIQHASEKIINQQPPENIKPNIEEVKAGLISLNETLFGSVDEKGNKQPTTKLLLSEQKKYGQMLNTVLENLNHLQTIHTKHLDVVSTTAEEQQTATNMLQNITTILESISSTVEDSINNQRSPQISQSTTSAPAIEKINEKEVLIENESQVQILNVTNHILGINEETNTLVKQLVESSNAEGFLKDEINVLKIEVRNLRIEKESLKRNLIKVKTNTRPSDCQELYMSGATTSGVYDIYPQSCECSPPVKVWCDMETKGGGWTVLIHRGRGSPNEVNEVREGQNFTKDWWQYQKGFGNPHGEHWIGLENLSSLTANKNYALLLEVTARSGRKKKRKKTKWGRWDEFKVSGQDDKYRLKVGKFNVMSTIGGDVFRRHNNQFFSTPDSDNDSSHGRNCAEICKGGWWYGRCYDIHPTGILGAPDKQTAVSTAFFRVGRKSLVALKGLQMKIKPLTCLGHNEVADGGHFGFGKNTVCQRF